jgi:hypothetical protein
VAEREETQMIPRQKQHEWAESLTRDELKLWVGAAFALHSSAIQGVPPRFYLSSQERASLTSEKHAEIFGDDGADYRLAASARYAREQGFDHQSALRGFVA